MLACSLLLFAGACRDVACLRSSDPSCRIASPCAKLAYTCSTGSLELRTLDDANPAPGGEAALGRRGDILIGNDEVVAVIAGLGDQNYVDLSGGSLLDLAPRGQSSDALNQVITAVGVLPRDAFFYTTVQLIDERPARVAVQLRGQLYSQPDTVVTTLFEVRPCEPGIRVRSAIYNGTEDPQAWTLTDGWYWSGREPLAFTPGVGMGFRHPPVDLAQIDTAFGDARYLAASSHAGVPVSYAEVGCTDRALEGFHSEFLSAFGTPRELMPHGAVRNFERFIVTAARGDVASSVDLVLEARRQLYLEPYVTLSGTVVSPPTTPGQVRSDQLSIDISVGPTGTPYEKRNAVTQVVPGADGTWSARVPAGKEYIVELDAFGRDVSELFLGLVNVDTSVPPLAFSQSGHVSVKVNDEAGAPIDAEVFVVPADDATYQATKGDFNGQLGLCAPWLGPPPGGSPACDRFLVWHARTTPLTVEMPFGRYWLYAYHGPFFSVSRQLVELSDSAATVPVAFSLASLSLRPQGTLSADFHIHGQASFDSSIPDWDRVLSFSSADLDVAVATDHDVVTDYAAVAKQLGIDSHVSTVSGVETTGHVPFLDVPALLLPIVIGHYNFWPLRHDSAVPRNGGPFDELIEPGQLFDRVGPLYTSTGIAELNHPWAEAVAGRDLGFPRALALSALKNLPTRDDGSSGGLYIRTPDGGRANDSHDAQEVMNGSQNDVLLQYRAFWFYMLNQGKARVGTANSDSHSLVDTNIGSPRNIVSTSTRAGATFDVGVMNQAVLAGHTFGTNGPIIEASIVDAVPGGETELPYGMRPLTPSSSARLRVAITAAPWVPVDQVRIIVNGIEVKRLTELVAPADPFGTLGLPRLTAELPLAGLLANVPAGSDAWIVVEAGAALPLAADLGGARGKDGIPDTGDNNGDGVVDQRDAENSEGYGPLLVPPPPDPSSPLYTFFHVTGGYPFAFTNPFLLDRNGNGAFDRIGVP